MDLSAPGRVLLPMSLLAGTNKTREEWDKLTTPFVQVRKKADGLYESWVKEHFVPVFGKSIFGGSLIAQCILAAYDTVSEDMMLHVCRIHANSRNSTYVKQGGLTCRANSSIELMSMSTLCIMYKSCAMVAPT